MDGPRWLPTWWQPPRLFNAVSTKPRRQPIPDATVLPVLPEDHQPTQAELEEEFDMPRLSLEQARALFFRPFRFAHQDQ